MLARVLLRPAFSTPVMPKLPGVSVRLHGTRFQGNNNTDTVHFGRDSSRQHRVRNVIASLFFLGSAVLWGVATHQDGHEIISAHMGAPTAAGAGSLVALYNALIPLEGIRERLKREKEEEQAQKNNKPSE